MKWALLAAALIIILMLVPFSACSSREDSSLGRTTDVVGTTNLVGLPDEQPGIRGTITRADSSAGSSNILVEEDPAEMSGSNKASVRIRDDTKTYRRSGGSLEMSSMSTLSVGKQVSVWFDGPFERRVIEP